MLFAQGTALASKSLPLGSSGRRHTVAGFPALPPVPAACPSVEVTHSTVPRVFFDAQLRYLYRSDHRSGSCFALSLKDELREEAPRGSGSRGEGGDGGERGERRGVKKGRGGQGVEGGSGSAAAGPGREQSQVRREAGKGISTSMAPPAPKIAPSMLSSDFASLASEAERMLSSGADWLHMDIMDGHFVPNLTLGAPVIKSLRKHTSAFLDCHLMVTNPGDYVGPMADAGASSFTFHVEAVPEGWQELVSAIKKQGMRAGVALKPGTPVEVVFPLVEANDPVAMVLVMTVEPGFGGQKFMPETLAKVKALRDRFPALDIEVDGGLGPSTIDQAAAAGANCIVAGSSIFGAKEPAEAITTLRKAILDVSK